jgi:hypothetical protein
LGRGGRKSGRPHARRSERIPRPEALLEDGEGDDLGVRELLEGSVEICPRVEDSVGVVDLAEEGGDRFFQECGFWDMLCSGHPVLLWSGLRMTHFLAHPTTQHTLEAAKAAALDRSDHIEKWSEQKRTVLTLYAAFAAQAPWYLDPEHRRAMYERLGLRVTAYKEGPPEIDITLDPSALPTSDAAAEALNAAWAKAMESETFVSMEKIRYVPEESTSGG